MNKRIEQWIKKSSHLIISELRFPIMIFLLLQSQDNCKNTHSQIDSWWIEILNVRRSFHSAKIGGWAGGVLGQKTATPLRYGPSNMNWNVWMITYLFSFSRFLISDTSRWMMSIFVLNISFEIYRSSTRLISISSRSTLLVSVVWLMTPPAIRVISVITKDNGSSVCWFR